MAEIRETHTVKERGSVNPWLAFFLGALIIALIAVFFMNASGSVTNPASGQKVEFNAKGPGAE
jgi:hypothetical protein